MGPLIALNNLLNFAAPALGLALLMPLFARLLGGRPAARQSYARLWVLHLAVAIAVLLAGLWLFGNDGKMASYAAMVLACATLQWVIQQGWRR